MHTIVAYRCLWTYIKNTIVINTCLLHWMTCFSYCHIFVVIQSHHQTTSVLTVVSQRVILKPSQLWAKFNIHRAICTLDFLLFQQFEGFCSEKKTKSKGTGKMVKSHTWTLERNTANNQTRGFFKRQDSLQFEGFCSEKNKKQRNRQNDKESYMNIRRQYSKWLNSRVLQEAR